MDRRSLIMTGAGLLLGEISQSALAQTPLPPAQATPQDGSFPPYQSPSAQGQGYQPSPYQPSPYQQAPQPSSPYQQYPGNPDQNGGYRPYSAGQSAPSSSYQQSDQWPGPASPPPYGGTQQPGYMPPPPRGQPEYSANTPAQTYSRDELVNSVSDFLGVTAETAGAAIERVFRDNGRPTGYVAGEEASGAFIGGLRYGKGLLYMKNQPSRQLFWQGPTIGFDWGGNASRVFTLCYNLQYPDAIFRRFPGVEGSAYLIGGLGINYQRAEDIVLSPIRAGVGLRLGANIGYLAYSRRRNWIPL